jgi:hypothetical protein
MNALNVIYHLARADFLDRTRRYSFLIMLGAVVFLGYQAGVGNINVQVGNYRGEYNSAWVGSMMAIVASFFLGWFGFYLVKGSVGRDRETGVGQIMAATPLTRPLYTLGKWLSNFILLLSMLSILAVVGVAIQFYAGESNHFDLALFLAPFLYVALPVMALVAALAVIFETVGFLHGGLGNILYLFLFLLTLPLLNSISKIDPAFEPLGFALFQESMGEAAKAAYPGYDGGFVLGSTDIPILGVFHWSGVPWTAGIILKRFTFIGIGMLLTLVASVFFDRFDLSHWKSRQTESDASLREPEIDAVKQTQFQPAHLTSLAGSTNHFVFVRMLISELKLLLKGLRWWWYAVAGGLLIASLVSTPENVRAFILPVTWLWPILIWSALGNREIRNNTQQMVFSSAAPLMRQLPASWLAGFSIAILTGSGAALKLLRVGDGAGLLAWICGALFIPSFALASGVWSNSNRLFEVAYVSMWYLVMNGVQEVDFLGANSPGNLGFFLPFSLALILAAFLGRVRQLQN